MKSTRSKIASILTIQPPRELADADINMTETGLVARPRKPGIVGIQHQSVCMALQVGHIEEVVGLLRR